MQFRTSHQETSCKVASVAGCSCDLPAAFASCDKFSFVGRQWLQWPFQIHGMMEQSIALATVNLALVAVSGYVLIRQMATFNVLPIVSTYHDDCIHWSTSMLARRRQACLSQSDSGSSLCFLGGQNGSSPACNREFLIVRRATGVVCIGFVCALKLRAKPHPVLSSWPV